MLKFAALIVLVVVGNMHLAWSMADMYEAVWCGEQFARNSSRYHNGSHYENGLACYENANSVRPFLDNIRFTNTSQWVDICRFWNKTVQCVQGTSSLSEAGAMAALENRSAILIHGVEVNLQGSLVSSIYHFPKRVCDSSYNVKSNLSKFMNTDLSCLAKNDVVDFYRCYETLDCELKHTRFAWTSANTGLVKVIERLSAGALKCMRNVIAKTSCAADVKTFLTFVSELQMPSIGDMANLNVTGAPDIDFGSAERCTIGVYGDPHLLYCGEDSLETCSAPGERIYLSNNYLDIRGTNVELPYGRTPKPTVIQKIVITFKSADGTSHVTTYTGDNGTLPGTFENGLTTIGEGYDQVSIAANGDHRVTFIQSSMGAILALRKWRNNYFFTLRMSSSVAKASHGLLGTGCPPSQIINRNANQPRLRRDVTQAQCDSECDKMVTDTQMLEICKYDCIVTRDLTFVNMSADAAADIIVVKERDVTLRESGRLYEESQKLTTPELTTPPSSASAVHRYWALAFAHLIFVVIYCMN